MAVQTAPAHIAPRWSRSYPPLALLAVAVLIAAFILPSRLNLPQSNPSTVLEYAPVPPEDTDETPPGNVSSLGLGSSNTLSLGGKPPPPPPPPPPIDEGTGDVLSDKRCVGDPPRQSEDPMSAPCVPYFDGDNFGATYQGVTGEEIKILLYFDTGIYSDEPTPAAQTLIDLDAAAKPACPPRAQVPGNECDHVLIRTSRGLAKFFNSRFQTYKRRAHYYAYFTAAATPSTRRADAVEMWSRLKPFAVLDQTVFNGYNQEFAEAMTSRGVMVFSSTESMLENAFYRRVAPQAWGFWPDVEHWAALYTSYVCQKVKDFPVAHAGNPQGTYKRGEPRKFGLFYTTDKAQPGLLKAQELIKSRLHACGLDWGDNVGTFPESNFIINNSDAGTDQATTVAKFQSAGVTTVLWLGGVEGKFTQAAERAGYFPEIVIAGDLALDNNANGRLQAQTVWQNAWGTQFQIRLDRLETAPGYRAYKEANPDGTITEGLYARDLYRDHFQLFQAIQVAGPKLTPAKVDQGFHAVPPKQSTDPYLASCFFDPGDYSCVKDAMEVWWDVEGTSEGSTVESGGRTGCMRMVRGGRRFLAGRWEGGDDAFRNGANDPCTAYGGSYRIRPL